MLGAVLRVPAPIPPLPAPARPLLLRRRPPPSAAPMASHTDAKNPSDAPPAPALAPQPPEKPLPGDCCGSGCVRCVWDVYYDELDAYNKALAAGAASDPSDKSADNSKAKS